MARDYLASGRAGQPVGFSYLGPVFRYRGGQPSQFLQAGIELFGRQDRAAADAEMLALALEATSAFGLKDVEIRTGDVALFTALIDALDLYPVWRRRLIKDFNRKVSLTDDIERLTLATAPGRNEYEGVLAALAGSDRKAALALVTDLMSIAGTTNVGGRTVAEIADRFLEQSTLKGGALPRDALGTIKRFLAISGDPDESVAQLRALASDAKLDLTAAIDQLESRIGFMAARGIDTRKTRFATSFGRGLDYYTGFEFELHAKGNGVEPLVAGGRYDGLMTQLGSATPIPAVGFSVWIEALTQLGQPVRQHRRERGMSAPFVLAVPSKGRLQENAEAFFARAGLDARQAAAARATIAAPSPASTMSRSPISRRARSPRNWRAAWCISASPAKICCAKASRMPTSACC